MKRTSQLYFLKLLTIFALYFVFAKIGLTLDAVQGFAALVWPPTGIAVAGVLLFGIRVWPAIALAAFLVNFTSDAPFLVACGIALGNTLESILAGYVLQRISAFDNSFQRLKGVMAFMLFGATFNTLVSATFGVTSLWLGGVIKGENFIHAWQAWWVGDIVGALVFAPLILVWSSSWAVPRTAARAAEWIFLVSSLILVCLINFSGVFGSQYILFARTYYLFPILLWAATRFGQRGATLAVFVVFVLAVWGTNQGIGPFGAGRLNERLFQFQTFLTIVAVINLLLAAAVTERKHQIAHKTAMLNAALDCIISMNSNGEIIEFNPAAETTFGFRRAEVLGRPLAEVIIPPAMREAHTRGLQRYLTTGEGPVLGKRLELLALKRDGTEFPVEVSIVALKLEGERVFTGFIRDIADEQFAKRRLGLQYNVMTTLSDSTTLLEASGKILQTIAQELGWDLAALWVVDEQTQRLRSIAVWQAPAINAKEFIEATLTFTFPIGKGLPGRIWEQGKPAWITNVVSDGNFPRLKIADKEGLHGAFGFPILSGKKVLGVIEFFSRELRDPDVEWLQTVSTLGKQIGQFMDRIASEDALRKAVIVRDEFLSIASHELRTPLTALQLQIQAIEYALRKGKEGEVSVLEKLTPCVRQVSRLGRLIDGLLDISRITAGRFRLQTERLDLVEVVKEVTDRFKEEVTAHGSELHFITGETIVGEWDRLRIEQVVTNLISNSIKYGNRKPIFVSVRLANSTAQIEVRDEGIGIALDQIDRIFERFERAVSLRSYGGLGLGLYISRQIVDAHGGKIWAQSDGRGATLTVELPLRHENKVVPDERASASA